MTNDTAGTCEEWLAARLELLDAENSQPLVYHFMFGSGSPLGRHEDPKNPGAWWRRHDEYASH
jgi:predicted dithiol-disulfide oxidoreductase (DUF899 family)